MLSRVCFQHRGFASKMMASSTNNKKDSAGRRLGIKRWGASEVRKGEILLKQRGQKWHPGDNTHLSKDFTIHAKMEGKIAWSQDRYSYKRRKRIHIIPQETPNRKFPAPPPFNYHPELFPELAQFNQAPVNFELKKPKQVHQRNPKPL